MIKPKFTGILLLTNICKYSSCRIKALTPVGTNVASPLNLKAGILISALAIKSTPALWTVAFIGNSPFIPSINSNPLMFSSPFKSFKFIFNILATLTISPNFSVLLLPYFKANILELVTPLNFDNSALSICKWTILANTICLNFLIAVLSFFLLTFHFINFTVWESILTSFIKSNKYNSKYSY